MPTFDSLHDSWPRREKIQSKNEHKSRNLVTPKTDLTSTQKQARLQKQKKEKVLNERRAARDEKVATRIIA